MVVGKNDFIINGPCRVDYTVVSFYWCEKLQTLQNFHKNAEIITKLKTLELRKGETLTCCPDSCYAFLWFTVLVQCRDRQRSFLSTVPVLQFTVKHKTESKAVRQLMDSPVGQRTQLDPIISGFLFLHHIGWFFYTFFLR